MCTRLIKHLFTGYFGCECYLFLLMLFFQAPVIPDSCMCGCQASLPSAQGQASHFLHKPSVRPREGTAEPHCPAPFLQPPGGPRDTPRRFPITPLPTLVLQASFTRSRKTTVLKYKFQRLTEKCPANVKILTASTEL